MMMGVDTKMETQKTIVTGTLQEDAPETSKETTEVKTEVESKEENK